MAGVLGRTIRIFLIDGSPEGMRLTDTSGWTGSCLDFARADYSRARLRTELERSGVYVLVGPNDRDTAKRTRLYVGESDVVRTRVDGHFKEKDFWTRAYVFTTKDDSLNKAHVRFLEAKLIGQALAAGVATLDNGTSPDPRGLREPEVADMENYLSEVLLLLPVLGVRDFQAIDRNSTAAPEPPVGAPLNVLPAAYFLKEKKADAEARDESRGFLVLVGASGPAVAGVMTRGYKDLRDQLIADKTLVIEGDQMRLTKDYLFDSPSAAASVITGGSRSGLKAWKGIDGRTLGETQAAIIESSPLTPTAKDSESGLLG